MMPHAFPCVFCEESAYHGEQTRPIGGRWGSDACTDACRDGWPPTDTCRDPYTGCKNLETPYEYIRTFGVNPPPTQTSAWGPGRIEALHEIPESVTVFTSLDVLLVDSLYSLPESLCADAEIIALLEQTSVGASCPEGFACNFMGSPSWYFCAPISERAAALRVTTDLAEVEALLEICALNPRMACKQPVHSCVTEPLAQSSLTPRETVT